MNTGRANAAYAAAFVDELARSELRHACVSPGSRSTPLAVALARHPRIRVWTHVDERSAAFFALGMAKAARMPVALLCTSGTAAANYYPAVIEARYARVPLVVLTADRPPELRENGAPQAIDQLGLYGRHAKEFHDMAAPDDSPDLLRYARLMGCRAMARAASRPAGPVHLNFPFREPLLPASAEMADLRPDEGGRPGGTPWTRVTPGVLHPEPGTVARLAGELRETQRGLIVCGPQDEPGLAEAATALASRLGWPVLADGLSGVRFGPHDRSIVLDAYDAVLRDAEWAETHAPDAVLRLGAMPTSKPLVQFLQRHPECRQVVVDGGGGWRDATGLAAEMVDADAAPFCRALVGTLPERAGRTGWTEAWLEADARARGAIRARLAETGELFEGRLFAELGALLPDGATLVVSNSMPVRDLETFFGSTGKRVRVLGNRGANGIDGVVSTALGAAAVAEGPLVLAIGDLAFYHDMNGLLAAKRYGIAATILLINNGGGGIFSFLPQAEHPEHFEELFGTPAGLDFRHAAVLYGARHIPVDGWAAFREGLAAGLTGAGLTVVEARTPDRERNVRLHRGVWAAVSAALRAETAVGAGGR